MPAHHIAAVLDMAPESDEIDFMLDILTAGVTSCSLEVPDLGFGSLFSSHASCANLRPAYRAVIVQVSLRANVS